MLKSMPELRRNHRLGLMPALAICVTLAATMSDVRRAGASVNEKSRVQETFPAPPADRTLIYFTDEAGKLMPLPFETGVTPVRVNEVAGSDKRSYVEVKGERAATVIKSDAPRFYLFVPDQQDVHTPFLVRLMNKGHARRVTAMRQRGQRGFAIDSEEIIMPHYRVLARDNGMLYMEFRARAPLEPGEYAFVGSDLQRIATFRIDATSNP
jgi:hypothetical protein